MSAQLSAQIRADVENDVAARRREVEQLASQLGKRETALSAREEQVAREVAERLDVERERLLAAAQHDAEQALQAEIESRDSELTQLRGRLKESQKAELDLQKQRRELQDRAEALELEVTRKLNEERTAIRAKALQDADEEHRLNMAEKETQIQGLLTKIDELKRKAEQGSQQTQGEVLELDVEDLLEGAFPTDTIEPVSKGVRGGDALHTVLDGMGTNCGSILWESKRTKNWGNGWLPKARDDQRSARAGCVVIVSEALPAGVRTFALIEGVWVCSRSCVVGLAAVLRVGLIELSKCRLAVQGQHGKMELVYNYLSSQAFQQRFAGVVEAIVSMQSDLESEKRSMQCIWSKRAKQIERAAMNAAEMYGDLQGIIGSSMPAIEGLSPPRIEFEGDDESAAEPAA
jgi:hypothetical protein